MERDELAHLTERRSPGDLSRPLPLIEPNDVSTGVASAEAARHDLAATPLKTFQNMIFPLTRPGIIAGSLLVFVPALGMFAISQLMSGGTAPPRRSHPKSAHAGQRRALRRGPRHDPRRSLPHRFRHLRPAKKTAEG